MDVLRKGDKKGAFLPLESNYRSVSRTERTTYNLYNYNYNLRTYNIRYMYTNYEKKKERHTTNIFKLTYPSPPKNLNVHLRV